MDKMQPTSSNIRIIISEGSAAFRSSMVKHLSAIGNIEVVAEASDLADTRKKVINLHPDVLVMDMVGLKTESVALVKDLW